MRARRCANNPLITPHSSTTLGENINGPSVIRAPCWLPRPLGRYYMYFAHHGGAYIRLAYADELCGEWSVHEAGTLRLEQAPECVDHIASPDVHVVADERLLRMYFHGPRTDGAPGQHTSLAVSRDGVSFRVVASHLGLPYFRVFPWDGCVFAIAKRGNEAGVLLRAARPAGPFVQGPDIIPRMRHAAVLPWQERFLVFYTRVGDSPERILVSVLQLTDVWTQPSVSEPLELLRPETPYEGVHLPINPSEGGATGPAHQLRDPAVLRDGGRTFLFYCVAGESGIAAAEITAEPDADQDG